MTGITGSRARFILNNDVSGPVALPAWVPDDQDILVKMWGGGGGGTSFPYDGVAPPGGSGGGFWSDNLPAEVLRQCSVVIGAGGVPGSNGGSTTLFWNGATLAIATGGSHANGHANLGGGAQVRPFSGWEGLGGTWGGYGRMAGAYDEWVISIYGGGGGSRGGIGAGLSVHGGRGGDDLTPASVPGGGGAGGTNNLSGANGRLTLCI